MRFRSSIGAAMVGICLLCVSNGCQSQKPLDKSVLFRKTLHDAAQQTYANYYKAYNAGLEGKPDPTNGCYQIPAKYWTDPIIALKPVKVYTYAASLAVVLKITGNTEEGKYFVSPMSSVVPIIRSDGSIIGFAGFEFYSLDSTYGALDFKRARGKEQKSQPSPAN